MIWTARTKDALHNCSRSVTGGDTEHRAYARGVLIGVASCYMDRYHSDLDAALRRIAPLLPEDYDEAVTPASWGELLTSIREELRHAHDEHRAPRRR